MRLNLICYVELKSQKYKLFTSFALLCQQNFRTGTRHCYDDIIMGFYGKAFDNGLQAKAAGSKPILFLANQNLGRFGLYHS